MVGSITATGLGLVFSAGFPDVRKSQVFATVAMLFMYDKLNISNP